MVCLPLFVSLCRSWIFLSTVSRELLPSSDLVCCSAAGHEVSIGIAAPLSHGSSAEGAESEGIEEESPVSTVGRVGSSCSSSSIVPCAAEKEEATQAPTITIIIHLLSLLQRKSVCTLVNSCHCTILFLLFLRFCSLSVERSKRENLRQLRARVQDSFGSLTPPSHTATLHA